MESKKQLMLIEVISSGFEARNHANYAEIKVNDVRIHVEPNSNLHFRGLHIVIIDPSNGKIVFAKVFDTYASSD